ncbi:response regulator [Streptomyces sp. L7]
MSTYGSISETRSLARGGGQHLLVAVDEPDNAELLSTTLELAGYRIRTAGSGTEVVSRLAEQRFELVVIDAELPEMDALEQGGRLVTHRPPVLLLTAWDALDRLLPELGAGERDYVTKPFRIAEVLARIQVLLRARAAAATAPCTTPIWSWTTPPARRDAAGAPSISRRRSTGCCATS